MALSHHIVMDFNVCCCFCYKPEHEASNICSIPVFITFIVIFLPPRGNRTSGTLGKRKRNVSVMLVKLECNELYRHLSSKAEIPVHYLFSQKGVKLLVIAVHM